MSLPPLSLYIHLPWCVRKCPYCDFNSYEADGSLPEAAYIEALLRDLMLDAPLAADRRLQSIFFGGGTPSLFSGDAIAQLLDGVRARLPVVTDIEITLEANPGTAEAARFAAYRHAGVNRLSIGVQSLRDQSLRRLGRIHDASEAIAAVSMARAAGFDNLNLDLMYALPGDTVADAMADLDQLIALQPNHISWYQLTLEPNTAFHRQPPPALPDDDVTAGIEMAGRSRLAEAGYQRYEVSAYARPGRRSRHNLNYWEFGDYIGIGAGAHGKLTGEDGEIRRRWRQRNPRTYLRQAGTAAAVDSETIADPRQRLIEFAMNALRLAEGFAFADFETRTGLPRAALLPALEQASDRGLIETQAWGVRPTGRGLQFLNDLIAIFDRPLPTGIGEDLSR